MENSTEEQLHWADEKEVIKSSKPVKLLFSLLKHLPASVVNVLVFPVGFFFYLFSARARSEAKNYQRILKEYTNGESPKKISPYKQIVSFALCLLEKISGWLGKIQFSEVIVNDDDCPALIKDLNEGKGALFIGSHLGNMELLRSLSSFNRTGCTREIPVTVIMDLKISEQFSQTLKEVNPNYAMNAIDPSDIGIETICELQEKIGSGELVVIAGDRTSSNTRDRFVVKNFLGKQAPFPYGVFLIATLLNAPTYYVFGLREKTITLHPVNNILVNKSKANLDRPRAERDDMISELLDEYVYYLEKFCIKYPYQWYNFHNFWYMPDKKETENGR